MEYPTVERRRQQRQELQQQPQQSAIFPDASAALPANSKRESPRTIWQEKANAQARKQSGKL